MTDSDTNHEHECGRESGSESEYHCVDCSTRLAAADVHVLEVLDRRVLCPDCYADVWTFRTDY